MYREVDDEQLKEVYQEMVHIFLKIRSAVEYTRFEDHFNTVGVGVIGHVGQIIDLYRDKTEN